MLKPRSTAAAWAMARAMYLSDPASCSLDTTNPHLGPRDEYAHDRLLVKIGGQTFRFHIFFQLHWGKKQYLYATAIGMDSGVVVVAEW